MKGNIILILLTSLILILILVCNLNYKYKENILYSQNDISGYEEKVEENNINLINRKEAINMATYIIEEVFNIDVNNDNSEMFVNLYKDARSEYYRWDIFWSENDSSGAYEVGIDSNIGEIEYIYINQAPNSNNKNQEISEDEVKDILNEFALKMDMNMNSYNLKISNRTDYDYTNNKTNYKVCLLTNKIDPQNTIEILIDCRTKSIVKYTKN